MTKLKRLNWDKWFKGKTIIEKENKKNGSKDWDSFMRERKKKI